MNRINKLFEEKKKNILSIYFTAGFPKLNDTTIILNELVKNGADLIEIGMPFSDPLADGPTIQNSSEVALKNGMSIKLLFKQLKDIRKNPPAAAKVNAPPFSRGNVSNIPLILMGYLNPVLQYGIEKFCKDAKALGIDGVIIPDLPMQEYLDEYKSIFKKYDLKNIFLITPQTDEARIRFIDKHSNSFIYMVSSASTTGSVLSFSPSPLGRAGVGLQEKYFKRIKAMKLKNPLMIGFGISDKQTFSKACEYANGAIIGSAFIKAIENKKTLSDNVKQFVKKIN